MKQFNLRKTLWLSVVILCIGTGLFISQKHDQEKFRAEYEQFLNDEYASIPQVTPSNLKEIPKYDRPDMSGIRDYFMTMDPELRYVPGERLAVAYQQSRQLSRLKSSHTVDPWNSIPANMGGRTRTLMFDPNTDGKLWAGSVTGGLWFMEDVDDRAAMWQTVNDFWDNLSISCMTYDPNNTETYYVGTGEGQTAVIVYRESSGRGYGIWKSTNEGQNWELMPSTKDFAYVTDIVVRNENGSSVIYAGVISGKYKGSEHQSLPSDGLYRSTDGGESWTQVLPDIPGTTTPFAPSDIELKGDGSKLYVGTTFNLEANGAACILSSENGLDWTIYDEHRNIIQSRADKNIPGRVMLAASPSDPDRIYAAIGNGYVSGDGYTWYDSDYILKSTDGGLSWTEQNLPPGTGRNWAYLSWHALILKVHPENPDILWAGGLDVNRSLDGGQSWEKMTVWTGGESTNKYLHADQHAMEYRPGNPSEMYYGTDGGVFYTVQANEDAPKFYEKNIGYNTLQFYTCAIHPQQGARHYLGGLQDNGTVMFRGLPITKNSSSLSGGDGAYCFIDADEDLQITAVYNNSYYFWLGRPEENVYNFLGNAGFGSGLFVNAADYLSETNTLFANAETSIGQLRDQLLCFQIPQAEDFRFFNRNANTGTQSPFTVVKFSPYRNSDDPSLFLGTQAGGLYRLDHALDTINSVTSNIGQGLPVGNISGIDIGSSEDHIIVSLSNYGVESVWLSMDGGENWRNIEGNLPDMPVRWVLFHPQNDRQAIIATEIGVWETSDLEQEEVEWIPATEGLANVRIDMLRIRENDNTVLAASHGRGLFTTTWNKADYSGVSNQKLSEVQCTIYPNPASEELHIEANLSGAKKITLKLINYAGQIVKEISVQAMNGTVHHTLNIHELQNGNYILQIHTDNRIISRKFIKK